MPAPKLGTESPIVYADGKFCFELITGKQVPTELILASRDRAAQERNQIEQQIISLQAVLSDKEGTLMDWDALLLSAGELSESDLDAVKAIGVGTIDREAEQRITARGGFEFPASSGNYFSMSVVAQVKWTGLYVVKDLLTYPVSVPTIDDTGSLSLADTAAVTGIYLTMIGTVRAILDAATAAKAAVMAATDAAEVAAVVGAY